MPDIRQSWRDGGAWMIEVNWQPLPENQAKRVAWARQCLMDDECQRIWLDKESWEWFRQAATDLAIQ